MFSSLSQIEQIKTEVFQLISKDRDRSIYKKYRNITKTLVQKTNNNFFLKKLIAKITIPRKDFFYKLVHKLNWNQKQQPLINPIYKLPLRLTPISPQLGQHSPPKKACHENLNHVSEIGNTIYLEPITKIEVHKEIEKL